MKNQVTDALTEGLNFLACKQQSPGNFLTLSSADPIHLSNAYSFKTTFSSTLILKALTILFPNEKAEKISSKIVSFLMEQKSAQWSWNYWDRSSSEYQNMPYPDDLDDTFCAATALFLYDNTLITGEALAYLTKLLTLTEIKPGGPYRTWIVPKNAANEWKDCDLIVNTNIAYFLSLQGITLPSQTMLFEKAIRDKQLTSSYYPTQYPFLYFLSRFYRGKETTTISSLLLRNQQQNGSWGVPLDTALAITILLLMGIPYTQLEKSMHWLLSQQNNTGSWNASCFYTGVNPSGNDHYLGGSEELTTAFCLEALHNYQQKQIVKQTSFSLSENFLPKIIAHMQKRFEQLPQPMKEITLFYLTLLKQKDPLLFLLPTYFQQTLSNKVPDELLINLGAANGYGWIAYTIYDDFFDGEPDITLLSLANLCLREVTFIYTNRFHNQPFLSLFQTIMDRMDNANQWEVATKKRSINRISEKSFGHALGPLAILSLLGYANNSPEMQQTKKFFHHYLTAKQLHDDAHDVFDDLKKGQITPIVSLLIKDYRVVYPKRDYSLEEVSGEIKQIFWETTLITVCNKIIRHCTLAKKSLAGISIFADQAKLEKLVIPFEEIAKKAIAEQKKAKEFLKEY